MPSRNINKTDLPETYYHAYSRGSGKKAIFLEPSDFTYFEKLLARYLSNEPAEGKLGYIYPNYTGQVDLIAYCLMGNHFHLLIYQSEAGAMTRFMKSLMSSYSRYFNLKYKSSGPLFESRYKASQINKSAYLEHISRYIHLNPRYWKRYPYSSLQYYLSDKSVEWIQTGKIRSLFNGPKDYMRFMEDYEEHKQMLYELKHELANN